MSLRGEGSLSGDDGRVGIGLLLIIRGLVSCLDGGITSRLGKDSGLARRNEEGGEVLIDGGKILLQILDECSADRCIFGRCQEVRRLGNRCDGDCCRRLWLGTDYSRSKEDCYS